MEKIILFFFSFGWNFKLLVIHSQDTDISSHHSRAEFSFLALWNSVLWDGCSSVGVMQIQPFIPGCPVSSVRSLPGVGGSLWLSYWDWSLAMLLLCFDHGSLFLPLYVGPPCDVDWPLPAVVSPRTQGPIVVPSTRWVLLCVAVGGICGISDVSQEMGCHCSPLAILVSILNHCILTQVSALNNTTEKAFLISSWLYF